MKSALRAGTGWSPRCWHSPVWLLFPTPTNHQKSRLLQRTCTRLILPRQSQIWAVLHASDSPQRLVYSLASGFLGRLCLSGEIDELDQKQWSLVKEVVGFYYRVAPIIKDGRSRLYRQIGLSWQHPQGAQAVLRTSMDDRQALLVLHTFAETAASRNDPGPSSRKLADRRRSTGHEYCFGADGQ